MVNLPELPTPLHLLFFIEFSLLWMYLLLFSDDLFQRAELH